MSSPVNVIISLSLTKKALLISSVKRLDFSSLLEVTNTFKAAPQ